MKTLLIMLALSGATTHDPRLAIRDFVHQLFIHGLPYEEGIRYDIASVPELLAMLDDPNESEYWPNIVVMLGIAGDDTVIEPLMRFMTAGEGRISRDEYLAKSIVPFALGYLGHRAKSQRAFALLRESLEPQAWSRRIRWTSPIHDSDRERDEQLAVAAILGITLTGNPAAREALLKRQASMRGNPASDLPAQSLNATLGMALHDLDIVQREGLVAYYRQAALPQSEEELRPIAKYGKPERPSNIIVGASHPPPIRTERRTALPPPKPRGKRPKLPPLPLMRHAPPAPTPSMPGPPQPSTAHTP